MLGIERTATEQEIKKAYRSLARKYHPDSSTEPGAKEKFLEISEAYEVLSDEQKRQMYDNHGAEAFEQGNPFGEGMQMDPDEILRHFGFGFEDLFGGGRSRASNVQRGADKELPLTLDFMEAANGCEKEVTFRVAVKCDPCKGTGKLKKTKT